MQEVVKEYQEYASKIGDRKSIYEKVVDKYNIKTAIYPGSHIDISPSFIIPNVTYVDNFKGTIKFFKNIDKIINYVEENKEYQDTVKVSFIGENYKNLNHTEKVDLIISQYAGFVGQDTKHLLKVGGILFANDSHGDATLAFLDSDYELIGVMNTNIETNNLDSYFTRKNNEAINRENVLKTMQGPKYNKKAQNYIFKKVK
ncbi:hypothetical protein NPX79_00880 [Spiroplasma endosymbiont of Anurida maritima]|uniref:hypothetical protein n=1 Tax=Spiroplasma endosymbiont of Anurida maritima TaxID=2967972 RepID=UPI0036D3E592